MGRNAWIAIVLVLVIVVLLLAAVLRSVGELREIYDEEDETRKSDEEDDRLLDRTPSSAPAGEEARGMTRRLTAS